MKSDDKQISSEKFEVLQTYLRKKYYRNIFLCSFICIKLENPRLTSNPMQCYFTSKKRIEFNFHCFSQLYKHTYIYIKTLYVYIFIFFVTPRIRMPSLFMHTSALLSQKKIKWVIKFTKSWKMFGTADSAVFFR